MRLLPQQVSTENELEDTAASGQDDADAKAPDRPTLEALGLPPPDFHSLVLDLSSLSFVDTVCLKSLKNVRAGGGHGFPASALTPSLALRALCLRTPRPAELPLQTPFPQPA